jgi:hypothetical protein
LQKNPIHFQKDLNLIAEKSPPKKNKTEDKKIAVRFFIEDGCHELPYKYYLSCSLQLSKNYSISYLINFSREFFTVISLLIIFIKNSVKVA